MDLRPYQLDAVEELRLEQRRARGRQWMAAWRKRNPEKARQYTRRYRERNRERSLESTRRWAKNNRATLKRIKFATRLKRYGITVEDWARAYHTQDGRCPGCGDQLRDGWHTATDHCHRTGRFRGLLCIRCNRSLGVLLENPETLRRLASYVEANR